MDIVRQLKLDSQGNVRLEYINAMLSAMAGNIPVTAPQLPSHWVEAMDSIVFKKEGDVDQGRRWTGLFL